MRYDNDLPEGVEVCACCRELYTQELTASEFCENCDIPDAKMNQNNRKHIASRCDPSETTETHSEQIRTWNSKSLML